MRVFTQVRPSNAWFGPHHLVSGQGSLLEAEYWSNNEHDKSYE